MQIIMKRLVFIFLTVLFIISINAQKKSNFANNQIIVKFKTKLNKNAKTCISKAKFFNTDLDNLNTKNSLIKIKLTGNKKNEKTFILFFNTKTDVEKLIVSYKNTNLFEYVEPNYIGGIQSTVSPDLTPNDNFFNSRQWALHNDGNFPDADSTPDADIDMDIAWDIEQGSSDIIVAVLDSGALLTHQEFAGRIWKNTSENLNGTDIDNNGYIDDTNGWNFFNNTNDINDANGHGTNVAGIIGANGNNNIGYAGVDWNCKLMILTVLDNNGDGLYSWWSEAIYYAVDNGATIINMSLRGANTASILEDAVNYAHDNNVAIVAAVGNENINAIGYPAAYTNTIAVGATDTKDNRANPFHWGGGSNYGPEIDLVAPGNRIYGLNHLNDNDFRYFYSGTSQATPHVTGVASLLLAQQPELTPDEIKTILQNTADDEVGMASEDIAGFDQYFGHGRLNAYRALLTGVDVVVEIQDNTFTIHPNPITDNTIFINNLNTCCPTSIIKIYNVLGALEYEKILFTPSSTIDLSSLSSGIYFVNLITITSSFSQRIIKI